MNLDASIEIIGGADGPTAIWVAWPADGWLYVLGAAAVIAAAAVLIVLRKRRSK